MMRPVTVFAALTLFVGSAVAPAHASAVVASFDNVGIGQLSDYNPFNILDNQSAGLTIDLTDATAGLVTDTVVSETLNGESLTPAALGSQVGNSGAYLAGFTFDLGLPSYIQYVPASLGETWSWTDGAPGVVAGRVIPGLQIGADNASSFAMMPSGEYTLLFAGAVDLAFGSSTSFGGTISSVPLPGSLAMFVSALIGLSASQRHPRSSTLEEREA